MPRPTFKRNTWVDNRRTADNLLVSAVGNPPEAWIVHDSFPGMRSMTTCPCCQKLFTTPEFARSAADAYFPVNPGDSDWIDAEGKPILDELTRLIRRLAARQP